VISLSKIPGAARRHELERELRAHLDDIAEEARAEGHDEAAIQRIVQARFGDSHEIAAAFAHVYTLERLVLCSVRLAALLIVSLVAVGMVIGGVQVIVTIWTAASITSVFQHVRWELFGFGAITLAYCGVYLGESLFRWSLVKTSLLSSILMFSTAGCLYLLAPGHVAAPIVAFICAALGRLLQRSHIPLPWLTGTAGPFLIAWFLLGPLIHGNGQGAQLPWLVGLGLTLSCRVLQWIAEVFERYIFKEGFTAID
jgi:hypothetical protein